MAIWSRWRWGLGVVSHGFAVVHWRHTAVASALIPAGFESDHVRFAMPEAHSINQIRRSIH